MISTYPYYVGQFYLIILTNHNPCQHSYHMNVMNSVRNGQVHQAHPVLCFRTWWPFRLSPNSLFLNMVTLQQRLVKSLIMHHVYNLWLIAYFVLVVLISCIYYLNCSACYYTKPICICDLAFTEYIYEIFLDYRLMYVYV